MAGGGAKAMCFYGFLRALEKNGIRIDNVSCYSGGAMIQLLRSSGFEDEELIKIFSKFRFRKFFTLNPISNGGLINLKKFYKYFYKLVGDKDIADIKPKTFITITDVTDASFPKRVVLETGSLAKAVMISCLVVPLFPLFHENGKVFADGGYLSLHSADVLRANGSDIVIGIFPKTRQEEYLPNIFDSFIRVYKSILSSRDIFERKESPVDIEISDFTVDAGIRDFSKAQEMYDSGFQKGLESLEMIKEKLS